jgi:plastocyanin domain-containing protein
MSDLSKRYAKQQADKKRRNMIITACVIVSVLVICLSLVLWNKTTDSSSTVINGSITTQSGSGGGENITVEAGKEVVWTIEADRRLGCFGGFRANTDLGIQRTVLNAGNTKTVRFTPTKKGRYTLKCISMGMTYAVVTVK